MKKKVFIDRASPFLKKCIMDNKGLIIDNLIKYNL